MAAKTKNGEPEIPDLIQRILNALKPGRGGPIEAADTREALDSILAALTIVFSDATFGKKIEADLQKATTAQASASQVLNHENAKRAFFSRKKEGGGRVCDVLMRAATNGVGTHGGKMPDARLTIGAMMPDREADTVSAVAPGLHSASANLAFRLSGADAQITSALRFLGMPLSIVGSPTLQVADILADDGHPLNVALREVLGPEAGEVLKGLGAVLRKRFDAGSVPSEISPYRKQVLMPIGDQRYVSLSPLYSYGIGGELSRRLRERVSYSRGEIRERFDIRVAHVGGTKPQNAGLLPNFLGGEMPRLLAMPWTPESGTRQDALRRLRSGTVPFPATVLRKSSLETLQQAMNCPDNVRGDKLRRAALRTIVDDMLWAVIHLAELQTIAEASGTLLVDPSAIPSHNLLAARLVGILPDSPLTEAEMISVAEEMSAIVRAKLRGRDFTAFDGGKQIFALSQDSDLVNHVALTALREFR